MCVCVCVYFAHRSLRLGKPRVAQLVQTLEQRSHHLGAARAGAEEHGRQRRGGARLEHGVARAL